MEEENPVEKIQEDLHHEAVHGDHSSSSHSNQPWFMGVALSSAILAAIASVASLYSGHAVNHAMTEQMKASDHWSHYQAKSIKSSVLTTQLEVLSALDKPRPPAASAKLEEYRKDEEDLKHQAEEREQSSEREFSLHEIFSRAVTLFQVSIAISAVSVLTRRKRFWWVSLGFGAIGFAFFVQGLLFSRA